MSNMAKKLKKIKRKYKKFKEDERGGDVLNNILVIVVTIIIIAALLLWAISLIGDIKQGVTDLFKWPVMLTKMIHNCSFLIP
ncbi:MAG: hypothetical protein ACFFCV_11745 [Promethearchaeota archaeon]